MSDSHARRMASTHHLKGNIDTMKQTIKKKTTKKTAATRKAAKREPFTSASKAVEEIEETAGETGRIAHMLFFNLNNFPAFIRHAVFDAMESATATLNMPNPNTTPLPDLFDSKRFESIIQFRVLTLRHTLPFTTRLEKPRTVTIRARACINRRLRLSRREKCGNGFVGLAGTQDSCRIATRIVNALSG